MIFNVYRYFLNPTSQQTLFGGNVSRKDLLNQVFDKKYSFSWRGTELGFVPERRVDNYIYGKIGKRSTLKITLPPDKNFEEQSKEHWPNCDIYISIDGDNNFGQKILIQQERSIFTNPLNQLKELINSINTSILDTGYEFSVNAVTKNQDFWEIIRANEGTINSIEFDFAVPNLFAIDDSLNEDLKQAQKDYGATHATLAFRNESGFLTVKPTDLIVQGASYVSKGGGEYKIRAKKEVYSSNTKASVVSTEIEFDPKELSDGQFREIIGNLFNRDA